MTKSEFRLFDVFPNPFNPSTIIEFDIPEDLKVKIVIFDVMGNKFESLNQAYEMGRRNIRFDGKGLLPGIY